MTIAQSVNTQSVNTESVNTLFAERRSDPAIRLLADAAAAVRTDAGFLHRPTDAAAGILLGQETPANLEADALNRVMARIDQAAARDRQAAVGPGQAGWAGEIAKLPSPVHEAALGALKQHRWEFGGFGIRRLPLLAGDGTWAELMRIEPGRGVADHDHAAEELTLILTGGYHDGHHHYGPGDITYAQPGFVHDPKADPGEVCYVLAVTYGPPRFLGVFGFLQWVLGSPAKAKAVWRA